MALCDKLQLMDKQRQRSRRALDRELDVYRPASGRPRPHRGWIRAVRDALGMSTADLARRMRAAQPLIPQLEQSEVAGSIRLETLERVAAALDSTLVYALVPNDTVEALVQRRAHWLADRDVGATDQSMRLEAQTPPRELRDELVHDLADHLVDSRRLWAERESS